MAGFLSPYDPYYHVKHANTYLTPEIINQPVYSTMNYPGGDLYRGYHIFLAPFTFAFTGQNYSALITGSKIFHGLLGATIFLTIYFLTHNFLVHHARPLRQQTIIKAATASTIIAFVATPNFITRLIIQRPHLISILAMLLVIYFITAQRRRSLFTVAALLPLFYSASFLIIIPPLIYVVSHVLYYRAFKPLGQIFQPLLITVSGLSLGIILRADSLNYLYNAYFVHLLALTKITTSGILSGDEHLPLSISFADLPWLTGLGILLAVYGHKLIDQLKKNQPIVFVKFYCLMIVAAFFLLTLLARRSVEFLIPMLSVMVVWTFVDDIAPAFQKIRYWPKYVAAILVIWLSLFYFWQLQQARQLPTTNRYQAAANYIEQHSNPGDIVFPYLFNNYPQLVFYNNNNRYIMGLDTMFTYFHDQDKYWLWHHLVIAGDHTCAQPVCSASESADIYHVISQQFKAKYVFIDGSLEVSGKDKFQALLDADPRFHLVFIDSNLPFIKVYQVSS